MPAEKPRRAKTSTLSLRLDPKTKFLVELVARIRGQSITTVVERSIKDTADKLSIGSICDEHDKETHANNLSALWDAHEGVRMLRLFSMNSYPTTYDEDEVKTFAISHRVFFYANPRGYEPKRSAIEILWPRIDRYVAIWRDTRTSDCWAAGKLMKADLAAAGAPAPDWPPKSPPPVKPATKAAPSPSGSLDDTPS